MLLSLGVSLYSSRIVLEVLGVSDFGIFNVVAGFVISFAFLNSSMAGATQRFLTFEIGKNNFQQLQKVFNVSISIHLLIAGIILVVGETIGLWFVCNKLVIPPERMEAALWVYHFSIFGLVLTILNAPFTAIIIAREKMNIYAYVSITEVFLRLFIIYALLIYDFDKLKLYGILTFTVTLITFFMYQIYCRKHFKESIIGKLIWDKPIFKEMAIFAGWIMNGNIAYMGYTQGLNILLNLFFGPVVNAARGISTQVQNAVNGFSSSIQASMNPQITKSYAIQDFEYMHKLLFTSSKLSFFLLFIISLPIFIEIDFILSIWLKEVPDHTSVFTRLTLLVTLLNTLSNPLIVSVHATGKLKKFQLWEGTILLLIVPISYLLLKMGFIPESVYIVHIIISILAQFARIIIVSPLIHLNKAAYFEKVVLKIIYVIPLSIVAPLFFHNFLAEGWSRLFTVGIISILSMTIIIYFVGLVDKERMLINSYFNKIFNKQK